MNDRDRLQQIQRLLRNRHSKDIVVPECKSGPTQGSFHRRLDVWAMARSWARPMTWGYEIKVSRADFARDQKWQDYLPMCRALFFVCPKGLIQPEEIPGNVGLLWAHGAVLRTKKKAEVRDPDDLAEADVMRYVLMSRATIQREHHTDPEEQRAARLDYWRRVAQGKVSSEQLGRQVAKKIRTFREELEGRERRLERRERAARDATEHLRGLGVDIDQLEHGLNGWHERRARALQELEAAVLGLPISAVESLRDGVLAIEKRIVELRTSLTTGREAVQA